MQTFEDLFPKYNASLEEKLLSQKTWTVLKFFTHIYELFFHEVCSGLLFNPIFPKKKQTHFSALVGPIHQPHLSAYGFCESYKAKIMDVYVRTKIWESILEEIMRNSLCVRT